MSDPDNLPWTAEDLARVKPTPRTKVMRRALGLSQEEFAAVPYPARHARDWEQGRKEPDVRRGRI